MDSNSRNKTNVTTIPSASHNSSSSEEDLELMKLFESWASEYGKIYNSNEEKLSRFEIFKDSKKYIDRVNKDSISQGRSLRLGLNRFADLTTEEFSRRYTGYCPPRTTTLISKVTEERNSAIEQKKRLQQELDLLRREVSRSHGGIPFVYAVLVAVIGFILGYILKRT